MSAQVDGLANPKGFVPVTKDLASAEVGNIYAVGVAIAPPGSTGVPLAVPKTRHMTELMAQASTARPSQEGAVGGVSSSGLRARHRPTQTHPPRGR